MRLGVRTCGRARPAIPVPTLSRETRVRWAWACTCYSTVVGVSALAEPGHDRGIQRRKPALPAHKPPHADWVRAEPPVEVCASAPARLPAADLVDAVHVRPEQRVCGDLRLHARQGTNKRHIPVRLDATRHQGTGANTHTHTHTHARGRRGTAATAQLASADGHARASKRHVATICGDLGTVGDLSRKVMVMSTRHLEASCRVARHHPRYQVSCQGSAL